MTQREFTKSAKFIAERNVSARVVRVVAAFDAPAGHLSVIYLLNGEPCEDDEEDCELTCAELIAAFPEIRTAETACASAAKYPLDERQMEAVVFVQK